jgi:catechol 2,3-dioxygenase-like lactoylglutathione lyase family enzyme
MKYKNTFFAVSNIEVSKDFYMNILGQKVKFDFGENVTFEGDFSIQEKSHFGENIEIQNGEVLSKHRNSKLYFEEEDIDGFVNKLEDVNELVYVNKLITNPWGQKVVSFYDPDMHVIEVSESMETVIKRYLKEGLSSEEISKITQQSVEIINSCREYKNANRRNYK